MDAKARNSSCQFIQSPTLKENSVYSASDSSTQTKGQFELSEASMRQGQILGADKHVDLNIFEPPRKHETDFFTSFS